MTPSACLPADMSRCDPSLPCPQRERCARANDWPTDGSTVSVMDFSVLKDDFVCWRFIDMRGLALLEAA